MRTRKEEGLNTSGWMRACFLGATFVGFAPFSLAEEDESVL